jgi:hypothetical protein
MMASPFKLFDRSRPDKAGADEYRQTLAREMQRYKGDRDRAVRSANIASGFGNSTAQQYMHPAAAAAAASGPATGAPIPQPRPEPAAAPVPADLPVSPPRPGMMWEGATASAAVPQNAIPLPSALSLASPLRGVPPELVNPGLAGMPPFRPGLGRLNIVPPDLVNTTAMGRGQAPVPERFGYAAPKGPRIRIGYQ